MTDSPAWVKSAESVLKFSDNLRYTAEPISNDYQNYRNENLNERGPVYIESESTIYPVKDVQKCVTLVSTLSSKQHERLERAKTTCEKCPQPYKSFTSWDYENSKIGLDGYHVSVTKINHTKRCTSCGTRRRALTRAAEQVDRLEMVCAVKNKRISFVTLTFPNYIGEDVRKGYDILKKKIRGFRRKYKSQNIEIDGYDYFEHTVHSDFRGWSNPWEFNVHSHGLWVMDFYDIYKFNSDWGHIAYLTELKGKSSRRRAINYARKYVSKDSTGHRNAQGFGACYGTAFVEIESQVKHLKELLDAENVNG